ncbi:hypothetical protein VF14_01025 [Nostoc linckia z18]|jgi:hypothetical protein|uniref:Uncharacterized protein n=3 Tax=Nostoc linckia TaxID=92942 RepID=A0A9Q6ENK0_NOSLI|nr:hypothetical protein VF02_04290 [Nostoc linckia z1]PHJ72911.1 hypothetical protein VF05_03210 [Nostoc linckia z3]PHJ77433.1 hypothetical protein VF03_04185 [Nostoc linckia z2]PHJ86492.1 hypothetical protein VF06_03115 [Nostoc linckia z4]PHJ91264.1 hypothetical protein VF07_06115 [Nostoc linckia z6]PHJ94869.1 hypothetical protein VF04_20445 [Nostoc linckia z7]PHK07484.1 hypothetical protein VF08_00525 [Nostoc linckia z8]PHK11405.1 hypothetical protein VF10_34930 [Nostoc linckia z13]PHK120
MGKYNSNISSHNHKAIKKWLLPLSSNYRLYMQISYLPLAWLNNIEQSILKKQLIVRTKAPLPHMLALMEIAIAPMRSDYSAFFRIVSQVECNSCQA